MNTSAFDMFRVLTLRRGSIWARYGVFIVLSLAFTTLLVVTVGNNSDNEDFFSIFAGSNRPTTRSRSHGEDGDENNEIGMPKIPVAEVQNEVTKFSRVSASRKVNAHDTGNTVRVTEDNAEDRSRTLRSIESNSVRGSRNNNIVTQGGQDPDPDANTKREFIKQMMKDAWNSYKEYAWGANELAPVSRRGRNGGEIFGNTNNGASIIDSLSTLHIMGLDEEFELGRNWTAKEFDFNKVCSPTSVFETTIRFVGGLLSAYALSKDPMFLEKAMQVADSLLPAFETPFGVPYPRVTPCRKTASSDFAISLAELGSLHLEFTYLSAVTRKQIYLQKVHKIRQRMKEILGEDGLYRNNIIVSSGTFSSETASIGAGADSFYEYLLKSWIQTGDRRARNMYDGAMDAMKRAGMFRVSGPSKLMYIGARLWGGHIEESFSHLACFSGGMLALGAATDPKPKEERKLDGLSDGANITNTCHESYIRTPTGLGPEVFSMSRYTEARSDYTMASYYILRPEVIESYFYLYRLTKDQKYRDWAWEAAQAIQKWCKAGPGGGYSGLHGVNQAPPSLDDNQQSFFLAETLKYLYLIFSSDDLIDLNYWVFNTEAHPLPIRGKNPMYSTAPRKRSQRRTRLNATG